MNLDEVFSPGGLLDRNLPGYEFRPSQLEMARQVRSAIRNREHLLVEAGTGIGKTLAYLVPAALSEKRVLVSTATKNLQEQLFFQDLPLLRKTLCPELRAVCLKGRQNYLCLRKYREWIAQPSLAGLDPEDTVEALSAWVGMTRTGDRSELDWLPDEDLLWSRLDARNDHCLGQKCPDFKSCFVTRIRQKSFESDLLVVNHALLFSNLALEKDEIGPILPDYRILIMDEAHEIEEIAGRYFGSRLTSHQLIDLCRRLAGAYAHEEELQDRIQDLESRINRFFERFPLIEGRFSLNFYPEPDGGIVDLRDELAEESDRLMDALREIFRLVEERKLPNNEEETYLRRLDQAIACLDEIFHLEDPESVYWFERSRRGLQIFITPVHIGSILRRTVFDRQDSAVLASATLTAENRFDYIRRRLGAENALEATFPGEFDYAGQSILYVPRHGPSPGSPDFGDFLLDEVIGILRITQGDAFILFTSYRQMHYVWERLREEVTFPLLRQGEKPRNRILEEFRTTSHAVLCATSSFWQGVDVRGPALKAVIIDKLPFQVPSEPLVAARVEQMRKRGEDAFAGYIVPSAVISLRQGLGRLIRSKQDYGILAVLDNRIWNKRYGRQFLKSLPNCPVTDNMENLENFLTGIVSETGEDSSFPSGNTGMGTS